MMEGEGFITQQKAAALCGVSQTLVSRWVRTGVLEAEPVRRGRVSHMRIRKAVLDAFIAAGMPGKGQGHARRPGLSLQRFAETLGLSSNSVRELVDSGKLAYFRLGRMRRIAPETLEAYKSDRSLESLKQGSRLGLSVSAAARQLGLSNSKVSELIASGHLTAVPWRSKWRVTRESVAALASAGVPERRGRGRPKKLDD